MSNVTSLYLTVDQDFSVDVDKHEDSTLIYLPTDIGLFKNSFVINLVQAVVSLVGVFVFFFLPHALLHTYILSASGIRRMVKDLKVTNVNLNTNP